MGTRCRGDDSDNLIGIPWWHRVVAFLGFMAFAPALLLSWVLVGVIWLGSKLWRVCRRAFPVVGFFVFGVLPAAAAVFLLGVAVYLFGRDS